MLKIDENEFNMDILSEILGEDVNDLRVSLIYSPDISKYDDYISIRSKRISWRDPSELFFSDKKTIFYEEIHRVSMNEYKRYLRDKKITNLLIK